MNLPKLKHRMKEYAAVHGLTVPPGFAPERDSWGEPAKTLAWRVSGHLREHGAQTNLAHTTRAEELWDFFYPPSAAQTFRKAMVRGYDVLNGVQEGSKKHAEICAYVGLSVHDPWCAGGHWYVAKKLAHFNGPTPANVNYVPTMELYAKLRDIIRGFDQTWLPGMSVTFCWDRVRRIGAGDHIGIIDQVKPKGVVLRYVRTDEANAGSAGPDSVRECEREWRQINCVFDLARLQR